VAQGAANPFGGAAQPAQPAQCSMGGRHRRLREELIL